MELLSIIDIADDNILGLNIVTFLKQTTRGVLI